jgi:XRE family transcriptional regulator, regulator of sulfur utilization
MKIGDKIRTIRSLKGLSQDNLAEMIGISRLAYGDIERNKTNVSEERLLQISNALGVSVEDIENVGESVANFFDQCNFGAGINNGGKTVNHFGSEEIKHKLEIAKLEITKLNIELEKAKIEVELWKLKGQNK